jgi:hypothetical protein
MTSSHLAKARPLRRERAGDIDDNELATPREIAAGGSSRMIGWKCSAKPATAAETMSSLANPRRRRARRVNGEGQSFVDARDKSFHSAPCFCQFIRMWRLVLLFLPSGTDSLSATQ